MSLVVPAEKADAVHTETDRVERILVVDDDVRLRTLLQRFLEDKGFVVKTAHDATQMDRLLQRELFSRNRRRLDDDQVSVVVYANPISIRLLLC